MNEKTQDNKKQFYAIDIIKFVFAFIVVAAHMFPFSSYSEKGDFLLVQGLARIILPFFFITAAFLFFRYSNISLKEDPVLKKRLWRYIERMSILFFFWSLVINLFLALGWLLYGVKAGVFQLLRSFFLPVGYALVINDTLFQVCDLFGIYVDAEYFGSHFCKTSTGDKPHITCPDDSYFHDFIIK